jgi:hypothetical protein
MISDGMSVDPGHTRPGRETGDYLGSVVLLGVSLVFCSTMAEPARAALSPPSPAMIKPVERRDQAWRVRSFAEDARLTRRNLFFMDFAKDGTAWIATSDGLFRYDGYHWRQFSVEDGLPSSVIRTVWFCCDQWPDARVPGGLSCHAGGAWKSYGQRDGLPGESLLDYFRDSHGRQFVMISGKGVACKEGERWRPWSVRDCDPWSMAETATAGLVTFDCRKMVIIREQQTNELAMADLQAPFRAGAPPPLCATHDGALLTAAFDANSDQLAIYEWMGTEWARVSAGFQTRYALVGCVCESPDGAIWCIGEEKDMTTEKDGLVGGKPVIRLGHVSKPTMSVYPAPPDKATGAAMVVCPGGGYTILAMDLEGTEVAEWLNSAGVTAVLLKYRVPARKGRERHLARLQDAQRAMSLVRRHAKEWGIDPNRIGIMGFSAGAHLSALISAGSDQRRYVPVDDADALPFRPNFVMLIPTLSAAELNP